MLITDSERLAAVVRRLSDYARADALVADCHDGQRLLLDALVPGSYVAGLMARRQGKSEALLRHIVRACLTRTDQRYAWCRELPQYAYRTLVHLLRKLDRTYGIPYTTNAQTATIRIGNGEIQCYGLMHEKFSKAIQGNFYHGAVLDELQDMWSADVAARIDEDIGPTLTDYNGWIAAVYTPGDVCAGLAYRITKMNGAVESGTEIEAPEDQVQREEVLGSLFTFVRAHPFSNPATAPGQKARLALYRDRDPDIDSRPWVLREYYSRWVADDSRAVVRIGPQCLITEWSPHHADRYLIGVDYGFAPHPSAIVVAVQNTTLHDKLIILEAEQLGGMGEEEITAWVKGYAVRYPGAMIHFDYAGGGSRSAEHMRNAGLPIVFADKTEHETITTRLMDADARLGYLQLYHREDPARPEDHPMAKYWSASRWELGRDGYRVADPRHLHDAARYIYRKATHHSYRPPKAKTIGQKLDELDRRDREHQWY